jgi:hypothetical protein
VGKNPSEAVEIPMRTLSWERAFEAAEVQHRTQHANSSKSLLREFIFWSFLFSVLDA